MSNFWSVVLIFFIFSAISFISLELGITTTVMEGLNTPDTTGDIGLLDALGYALRFVINNLGSFFQIITFQTSLPNALNTLIVAPLTAGVFYLGVIIVRGGAS